jgi:hypothetical protein
MTDVEQYCRIHHSHDHQHLGAAQIARELHLHPATVARWLATDKFCPRHRPREPASWTPSAAILLGQLIGLAAASGQRKRKSSLKP